MLTHGWPVSLRHTAQPHEEHPSPSALLKALQVFNTNSQPLVPLSLLLSLWIQGH